MAFDGITIANIVKDLQDNLIDGRLSKIAQPEPDELLCTIKGRANRSKQRLCLSASASLPAHLSDARNNKPSPMTAPNFCMLLSKACPECAYRLHFPAWVYGTNRHF